MVLCLLPPRELNPWERAMLERLLSLDFPGVTELRDQIDHLRVAVEYPEEDPSVRFTIDADAVPPASVAERVPVHGEIDDDDGLPIFTLLHVIDGFIRELELWRGGGGSIRRLPDPDSVTVFVES